MLFKSCHFALVIFHLSVLSIESRLLKSPPIVKLSIFLFNYVHVFFIYFGGSDVGYFYLYTFYIFLRN